MTDLRALAEAAKANWLQTPDNPRHEELAEWWKAEDYWNAVYDPDVVLRLLDVVDAARAHLRADAGPTYSWTVEHEAAVQQENQRHDARNALRAALVALEDRP